MSGPPGAVALHEELLRGLLRAGLPEAELFVKRGRSRRLAVALEAETSTVSQERAWAVRAGTRRASFFAAGTGEVPAERRWPVPEAGPLRLPEPQEAPPWNEPSDFEAPLIGEGEGFQLLASLGRELAAELPGARLLQAALEDGSSEGELASSRGVRARFRHRVATLYLEAVAAGPGRPGAATLYLAAREARRFHPKALARRLADRLAVCAAGNPPEQGGGGGELLLAPPVGVALLAALLPLLVGPAAVARLAGFKDRHGRIGSELLTIADDGRLPGGAFESEVDGEGVPTREAVLVERGIFRQPLLAWWQAPGTAAGAASQASGCCRRAGWRDLPLPGPTHLYLRPDPKTPVAGLLGTVGDGSYLIETTGAGSFDLEGDRFVLPVCGFALRGGRASAPLAGAVLCGGVGALLKGIVAVGRDLTFQPVAAAMLGAPTLLVRGLELRAAP